MKLVPDWKEAWKWISMWAFALAGALQSLPLIILSLPERWQKTLSDEIIFQATLVVIASGMIGRLIDQKGEEDVRSSSNDLKVDS